MNLKHIDFDALFRRVADKHIEDAMAEGKFDNLPGKGEPIQIDEAPADENARALWWALRLMKQNDFIPDEVRWRKAVDVMKAELSRATDPEAARKIAEQINALVLKLKTLGTNAISIAVKGLDVEVEVSKRSPT